MSILRRNIIALNKFGLISTFRYNISSANTEISFSSNIIFNYIEWGDNTSSTNNSHTYVNAGEYTVKIYGLQSIVDNFANSHQELIEVNLAPNISYIGDRAFCSCASLESINISQLNIINYIGQYAFDGTPWYINNYYNLQTDIIYINNIAYAYKGAQGTATGTLTLNSSTQLISAFAFSGQYNLNSILLNYGIKTICNAAFGGCSGLSEIGIPVSVDRIGQNIFVGDIRLSNIYIGSENWYYCISYNDWINKTNGTTIDLSNSVENVSIFDVYGSYYFYRS